MIAIGLFRNAGDARAVFREGDSGHEMVVARRGEVDILVHEHLVDTRTEGAIFGEMALIGDRPRSATARAKTDRTLVPVDERRFTLLIQQTPQSGPHVMRVLAERLRRADAWR